ncbi:aldo/keto reductase [Maribacter sp. MMG018]|uniref:aldo/keto reductase n=1 Tax=Maribacter sp. MMG018 TaxID=2822688 RepID=UPI001B372EC9|nr:aldo/keto reductase [Maribacter sp. MMG018]MBQ4915831.1 aldo/keto reductase [Maribacter sp. MMG018]
MKKRLLGNTGIHVSEIAFGGVEIGMPYGIGVKSQADMLSQSESVNLLHAALDKGINFFDTARMYGASENIMGQAFKDKRNEVIISTKCVKIRDKFGVLPSAKKIKQIIEKSLNDSLKALQTDYVDVYMLHQADLEILDNDVIAEAFLELKNKGMIRATGASTYSLEETKKTIEVGNWDVVQLPYNLMNQSQEMHFPLAEKCKIGIMVRSVLFKGILSKKGRSLHPKLKDVQQHLQLYKELCSKLNCDLAGLALKFALSSDQVSSVLVGIDRIEYLKNSVDVADGNYLDEELLGRARELEYPDVDFLDLVKWERMGWLT